MDLRMPIVAQNSWDIGSRLCLFQASLTSAKADKVLESGSAPPSRIQLEHFTKLSQIWCSQASLSLIPLILEMYSSNSLNLNNRLVFD